MAAETQARTDIEQSPLSELRSRLECMSSNTQVEELLERLSALEEY